ncbi:MAG TPA: type 4a pilus biogenesis protein PilO [Methylophilaceae bacterium]|nr:type 4a pilus biogenesis protein PilO [Methylophilaceae bacterium]
MKLEDFNNIDFNNTGSLPLPVKAVLLGVAFIVIVAAGYWFLWKPALEELDQAKAKETELRQVFLDKKRQAINLDTYKQQMVDIEKTFGALLKQLPDRSQMDGLLTDINQAGLERGLEFELFKPGQEVQADFYAEMPISIKVIGSYHNLGLFASDVSRLSRIVTLNNLSITSGNKEVKDSLLVMEAVAKTYRYLDSNEMASKQQAEKDQGRKKQ